MNYLSTFKQKKGNYKCTNCGTTIELIKKDVLPPCPTCGNNTFQKFKPKN